MSGAGAAPIRLFLGLLLSRYAANSMAQSSSRGSIRAHSLVMAEVEFRHQNLILVTVTPATMEKTSTFLKRIPTLKPVVQAFQREPWQQWYTIHPSRMRQSGQGWSNRRFGPHQWGVSPHVTPRHNDIHKAGICPFCFRIYVNRQFDPRQHMTLLYDTSAAGQKLSLSAQRALPVHGPFL